MTVGGIEALGSAPAPSRRRVLVGATGVVIVLTVLVLGLLWAKWLPYAHKAGGLASTHLWTGPAMFVESGAPGAAPTLAGAWRFTTAYLDEIWKGFAVALVAAAAIDALVPRAWLVRAMNRRGRLAQAVAGGTAALPSLMCTCCTAPLTVGLRRRGVGTAASLAYWVGNPVLNPAVLVFLFLVAPWQFGVVRLVVGAGLVFGASAAVAKLFGSDRDPSLPVPATAAAAATTAAAVAAASTEPQRLRQFPRRFAVSLVRLAAIVVPAYVLVVFVIGGLSGWMSAFSGITARLGVFAVIACALVGMLLVIPTGGEIPVVLALSAAGVAAGSAGALLITLPALSAPSMAMVGRALSWRVTAAMAGAVVVAGLVSGLLLWVML